MIQRDGSLKSLWQQMPVYRTQNSLNQNTIYDVVIVGGGITGITTALELQKIGLNCLVLEANNICFGTTGGTTAHLNTLLDTPYTTIIKNFGLDNAIAVAHVTRKAINLVKQNIEEHNIDCEFSETPAYLFAQNDDQVKELQEIYEACNKVKVDVSFSKNIPVPIPFTKAMEIAAQAKFHPVKYVYGLAKVFEDSGGTISENIRVHDVKQEDNLIHVVTTRGDIKANKVIFATHIPPGINLVDLRCVPYRSYAMAVKLKDQNYPEGLVYDMYDPYHYYRTQEIDGSKYLIVGGEDHKTAHQQNTNASILNLESHVRTYFDVEEITNTWSSQYFEPVDGLPYIGHLPGGSKNVYVATGYGGNGMTYSHVAALVLRELITEKPTLYTELFMPTRVKPIAGFTEFVEHNVDVVKQFAGKFFSKESIDEIASIAPGEGKVVKYDGEKIALSKTLEGVLHAVSPICTHMRCAVTWNLAEKSWDCPCHGARYSCEGKVLTGPAVKDLESIDLEAADAAELRYSINQETNPG